MRILSILILLSLSAPTALAYPEYPAFQQTQFAEEFGTFRWWQSCWWRVYDPYVYVLCQPDGQILLVYPDGSLHPASQQDLARLFSLSTEGGGLRGRKGANRLGLFRPPTRPRTTSRLSARRLSPAPGDGFRLSTIYPGRFLRPDGSRFSFTIPSGTGVFSFDGFGSRFQGDFRPFVPRDTDTGRDRDSGDGLGGRDRGDRTDDNNNARWRFGRDGTGTTRLAREGGRFQGSCMHPIFYKPVLGRCQSIYDSIDGGMFGPIPCTSYPGVFGPRTGFVRRTQ